MKQPGHAPPPGATDQLRRVLDELLPVDLQKMAAAQPVYPVVTPPDSNLPAEPTVGEYRLAVFAEISDPHVLAELISRVLGERPLDALIHSRHTPGILPPRMTFIQANELVELLHDLGVQAAAVWAESLPDIENAATVHHACCKAEGFEVLDLHGAVADTVPWIDVAVIAIGLVPGEAEHRYIDSARPTIATAASRPRFDRVDTHPTEAFELYLLRRHPTMAYAINHRQFNYDGLGSISGDSATANFERFAAILVNHASVARRTPSTHAFLSREHVLKYSFASRVGLQQQALLQWVIGEASAAP